MNATNNVKIAAIAQDSRQWHDWRAQGIGGSEIAAIMGKSPFSTAYRVFEEKVGLRDQQESNFAMERGKRLEPVARAAYEEIIGEPVQPVCVQRTDKPWLRCSLDGASMDLDHLVEIKVPGQSTIELARKQKLPEHYMLQVQYQMLVTGAESADFVVYDHATGELIIVLVERDEKLISEIEAAADEFWHDTQGGVSPVLTSRDKEQRFDDEWEQAAQEFASAKAAADAADNALKAARKRLEELAGGVSSIGAGVRLSVIERAGNVDYKKIPELKGVDLERYRGKPVKSVRIDVVD